MNNLLDPRRLLAIPMVYVFFQWIIGVSPARKKLIQTKIPIFPRARVLEVGCGPGTNRDHLPKEIEYIGCDMDEKYIVNAKKKFGDRGDFVVANAGEIMKMNWKPFDFILSIGLLHHLDSGLANNLIIEAHQLLKEEGCFIAIEPCYSPEQSSFEKWLISKDRGRYIRNTEGYLKIVQSRFQSIETIRFRSGNLTPNAGFCLIAKK